MSQTSKKINYSGLVVLFLATMLSVPSFASVWKDPPNVVYTMKEGESLTSVLVKLGIGKPNSRYKLYGRNGWLARIEKLNPGVQLNKLEKGQKIVLPAVAATLSKEMAFEPVPASTPVAAAEVPPPPPAPTMNETTPPAADLPVPTEIPVPPPPTVADVPAPPVVADVPPPPVVAELPPEKPTPVVPPPPTPEKELIEVAKKERVERRKRIVEVVKNPEKARIDEITSLPPSQRKRISPKRIAKKLNREAVANLEDHEIKKVPKKAIQLRAKEVSLEDGSDPEMKRLFKRIKKTAKAYVGARGRFSIGASSTLQTRFRSLGAFAEVRHGWFDGLRLNFEQAPKYEVETSGPRPYDYLKLQRYHLGWAFGVPLGESLFTWHITPRIGTYFARAGLRRTDASGTISVDEIKISDAMSTGGEMDLEWAQYFLIVRAYAGYESLSKVATMSSTRAGVETYIKGASRSLFGIGFVPAYLAFAGFESLEAEDEKTAVKIKLAITSFGFGLMLHID